MSASLVGSEMCIRDRDWQAQAASASVRAPLLYFLGQCGARGSASLGEDTCLLYTSDAADDM
eukprot:6763843-Alexandrium_andersonii.AAC.1